MAGIQFKGITKRFGNTIAVDNLDLDIPDGSFTTLLGPSGCGKTTTLRMLAGLETPSDAGEIWIGETCVYSAAQGIYVPPKHRKLGLVFQSYALWPHLTVFDNIAFGLTIKRLSRQDIERQVRQTAETLHIDELLGRYPNELSGGQQQRVAIARVLIMRPEVLLLDEPLSNLDAKLRMDMRAELKRLHKETGSTIMYVTHDQLEALTMSSHVAVMHKGVLQQWASPMEIYTTPANLFTADFMGNPRINIFPGVLKDDLGQLVLFDEESGLKIPMEDADTLRQHVGKSISLGLRPEDFQLFTKESEGSVEGSVYSVLPAGPEWYLRITLGKRAITATTYALPTVDTDDPIWVAPILGRIKCFDTYGNKIELGDRA